VGGFGKHSFSILSSRLSKLVILASSSDPFSDSDSGSRTHVGTMLETNGEDCLIKEHLRRKSETAACVGKSRKLFNLFIINGLDGRYRVDLKTIHAEGRRGNNWK
jgi:hypothetical protein